MKLITIDTLNGWASLKVFGRTFNAMKSGVGCREKWWRGWVFRTWREQYAEGSTP